MITSVVNEKIKNVCMLHEKKNRDKTGMFIIEGDHLVNEALKHDKLLELYVLDGCNFDNSFNNKYIVSKNVMEKMSSNKSIPNVLGVAKKNTENKCLGNIIALDGIQDPGNLGTIIRSSVAFNIDTIILSNDSVDLYNDKVIRSTEGNIFNINVIRCDLFSILNELKNNGYDIIGTSVTNGMDVRKINSNKYVLVMGNEGNGVRKEVSLLCNKNVYISMNSKCESLNVGCSASILLYELDRGKNDN